MSPIIIKTVMLWAGWLLFIGGTIYILLRGKTLLNMVKGSLIGRLTVGLMVGFFVELLSVLILCTVLLSMSEQNAYMVLPFFLAWIIVFFFAWKVMRKTRQSIEKMAAGK